MTPTRIRRSRFLPIVFAVVVLATLSGCTFLFFKSSGEIVKDARTAGYAPGEVAFTSSDGVVLSGWYFRARGRELGTILVCHGNVENMSTHVKLDLWLIDAGYNLFIFDYRGYGRSEGSPDVPGIARDAEAALETVLTLPGEKEDGIIVFGKSLGGAAAVYTVANSPYKDRVKSVVLDSAFSSYRGIARDKIAGSIIGWPLQYPLSYLVTGDKSPVDYIRELHPIPVLIIHGYQDEIVPVRHGRILYEAASEPKEFWEVPFPGHVVAGKDAATRERLLQYLAAL